MINFIELDNAATDTKNQTAYTRLRYNFISTFEGVKPKAYLDSVGIPTIGIGFNLRDDNILTLVLKAYGMDAPKDSALLTTFHDIVKARYANDTVLQTALNTEIEKHAANRSTFAFSAGSAGKEEMRVVFDTAVQIYDDGYPAAKVATDKLGRVNAWLADIPPSYERIVLVDMSYNGLIKAMSLLTVEPNSYPKRRAEPRWGIRCYETAR